MWRSDLTDFVRLISTIINHEHIARPACGVGLYWQKNMEWKEPTTYAGYTD